MPLPHHRYLVLEHAVGSAIVNFPLNAAIAWLMFRGVSIVPLWGQQSIAGDTIGTTFFLPLFTCLIVTRLTSRHVRAGRVQALHRPRADLPVLGRLPDTTLRRGAVLGGLAMALVAPPALWALTALNVTQLDFWDFVLFKASFAAVLGAAVTPLIGACALADARFPEGR